MRQENLEVVQNEREIKIFRKYSLSLYLKLFLGSSLIVAIMILEIFLMRFIFLNEEFNWLLIFISIGLFSAAFFVIFILIWRSINKNEKEKSLTIQLDNRELIYNQNSYLFRDIKEILIERYSKVRFGGKIKEISLITKDDRIELPSYNNEEIEILTKIIEENSEINIHQVELRDEIPESSLKKDLKKINIDENDSKIRMEIVFDTGKFFRDTIIMEIIIFLILSGFLFLLLFVEALPNFYQGENVVDLKETYPFELLVTLMPAMPIIIVIFNITFFYIIKKKQRFGILVIDNQNKTLRINEFTFTILPESKIEIRKKTIKDKEIQEGIIKQNGERIFLPFINDPELLREVIGVLCEEMNMEFNKRESA